MSSKQQQKSVDLIEFCTNSGDNMDVLDKPNTGVVQKMVMSETASASLIATAVAKLTTSSVTTTAPSVTNSALNKSESDSISSNQKSDNVTGTTDTVIITTTMSSTTKAAAAAPLNEPIQLNPSQESSDSDVKDVQSEVSDLSSISDSDSSDKTNECENSLIYIRDVSKGSYLEEMHEVPLSNTPIDLEQEEETEEVDHLSPLIMDNHTVLEHRELFKESLNNLKEFHPGASHYRTTSLTDSTKDSPATSDSDSRIFSSFEQRRDSNESAQHDYSSDAVSSDENAKDSCDVQQSMAKLHTNKEHHQEIKSDDEDDDEPIEIPTDEMSEKIVQQVEFYFSNENILKDAFLLKHVRRNKEGFVSLKLISSFKRVRQLTKDWRVVGYAIKLKSKIIEVNDLGTKIRRLEALPVFDETMPSRTVVATDLPIDKVTIEKVSEIFSKFGEIALIRILHAGGQIPPDVRQFMNKYPELHQKECAFVEYTESKSARNAMAMETEMHLYEMVAPKKKTGKKASVSKLIESYIYANTPHTESERSRPPSSAANNTDFKLRRNSSNFYVKPEHLCNNLPSSNPQSVSPTMQMHQHVPSLQSPRKYSFNNDNCEHFGRRVSNTMMGNNDLSRKYSSCSEGYSSCSEMSRRTSNCSDMSRRTSNCSDGPMFNRRLSGCSDFCACSRRSSQCSSDQFRRISQCSDHNRRFSNTSMNYDRRMSNGSDGGRRISFDGDYDRKISVGSNGCDHYRKISGTYDSMPRKYSNGDLRKVSVDSGYERKFSNSSMNEYGSSPRSRSNSFLMNTNKNSENLVRTPIGPDGSKGFSTRARKVGQVVVPV
ncbi:uncharacterized protein LOC116344052 [Contarinia nasturtii]|uniref:uncharacterized protein LOC116344052 n=1 Tax=Contarinia nasturtii TaxID=265458 RepID=UPI0012D42A91|nr:uncharacterized protein LOC116344052 [Contarinia nasturtii]